MSIMVSPIQATLWKEIEASWSADPELQTLNQSLTSSPQSSFTWLNGQLRRKGKLLVGKDTTLRTKIISL